MNYFTRFKKRKKTAPNFYLFSVENNYLFNGRFQYVRTTDILFVINKNHSPNYWKVVLHCVRYFFHVRDFLLTIPGRARPPGYPPAHASLVVKSYQNLIWKKMSFFVKFIFTKFFVKLISRKNYSSKNTQQQNYIWLKCQS